MKKKYITLEEVLALRGTDTKIYEENCCEDAYYKFVGDVLCGYNDKDDISTVGAMFTERFNHYILEPEEFKVEKTGKLKKKLRIVLKALKEIRDNMTQYDIDNGIPCDIAEDTLKQIKELDK